MNEEKNASFKVLDGEEGNEYRRHLLPSYKAHRKKYLRQSRGLRSAHDTYQSTTECKVIDVLLKCNVPVCREGSLLLN